MAIKPTLNITIYFQKVRLAFALSALVICTLGTGLLAENYNGGNQPQGQAVPQDTQEKEVSKVQSVLNKTVSGSESQGSGDENAPLLKGGISKLEVSLEKLRDIGLDLKQVLRASSNLYDEVTIQPVNIVSEPSIIGNTVIYIPVTTRPAGPPQQPRKERVFVAMGQMRPIVYMLKEDVDGFLSGRKQLEITDKQREDLSPLFQQWVNRVNSITTSFKKLDELTPGPRYDNDAIATVTQSIHVDVKQLDKVRVSIYKYVQKEARQAKRA